MGFTQPFYTQTNFGVSKLQLILMTKDGKLFSYCPFLLPKMTFSEEEFKEIEETLIEKIKEFKNQKIKEVCEFFDDFLLAF